MTSAETKGTISKKQDESHVDSLTPLETDSYDLIIIGAGIGAMTVAATMSRRRKRVLVIEKHKVLGGYASIFARKGVNFDVSLHQIGGVHKTRVKNILENAGVYHKLNFIKSEYLSEIQIKEDGEILKIPNGDIDAFRDMLLEMYPHEARGIKRWFWFMKRYGREVKYLDWRHHTNPLVRATVMFFAPIFGPLVVASQIKMPRLSWALRVKDEELRSILLHFSAYYGSPAEEIGMLFPMVANYGYYSDGGYYTEGGGYAITRQLSMVVRRNGGSILTGQEVTEITTNDDGTRATGVRLANNPTHYTAPKIVCGANPVTVYNKLLTGNAIAKNEGARIAKIPTSMTASVLYMKINVQPEELNPMFKGVYELMRPSEMPESEFYRHFQERQGFSDDYKKDGLNLTIHSAVDRSGLRGLEGAVLNLFYCDNYKRWNALDQRAYKKQKQIEIEKMLNILETVLPNLRQHIEVIELATPKTMEKFTSNHEGSIYGFTQNTKRRFRIQSPIKGLAFVSAWSDPGGGYEGSLRAADTYCNPMGWGGRLGFAALLIASILGPQILLHS